MKMEYAVLDYLVENDDGKFIDLTFFDENREALKNVVNELESKHLIVTDDCKPRDFKAFGISDKLIKCIRAKITMNGKIYFASLKQDETKKLNKKRNLKLAQYLNFL